jgi:hypothetical protein
MPAFIQAMIRQALGRPVTQDEFDYWMARASTMNRQQMAYAMLTQNPFSGTVSTPPSVVVPDRRPDWERWWRYERRERYRPYRW